MASGSCQGSLPDNELGGSRSTQTRESMCPLCLSENVRGILENEMRPARIYLPIAGSEYPRPPLSG
jgi:hypothetical protein